MKDQYQQEKIIEEIFRKIGSNHSEYSYLIYETQNLKSEKDKAIHESHIMELKQDTQSLALSLSRMILVYLDKEGLVDTHRLFKTEIYEKLIKDDSLLEPYYIGEIGEFSSFFYDYIYDIFRSFDFFSRQTIDRLLRRAGIKYLENILWNTAVIIQHIGKKPKSEPEVYNSVKFVLLATFDSARQTKARFFKNFKQYKPDILIPELNAAIEYKYAKSENDLKNMIDQISVDVRGYTDDNEYKIFYAVFYVERDFWGLPRFRRAWKEMKFPKNWKSIYVIRSN